MQNSALMQNSVYKGALQLLSSCLPTMMKLAGLMVIYFVVGHVGLWLQNSSGLNTSAMWAPSGIALAATLLYGPRVWPAIFAGAFLLEVSTHFPWQASLIIAAGSTLEALVATHVLRYLNFKPQLTRISDVLAFCCYGATLSPLLAAFVGAFTLWITGLIPFSELTKTYWLWWVGDGLGILLLTPMILAWSSTDTRFRLTARHIFEFSGMLALVLGATHLAFGSEYLYVWAVFPLLIWISLRFGLRGGTVAILMLSLLGLLHTSHGHGPFASDSIPYSFSWLQLYLATAALTSLIISTSVEAEAGRRFLQASADHYRQLTTSLQESRERLKMTVEAARVGTWDWDLDNGTITYNDYLGYLLGSESYPSQLSWQQFRQLIHPQDQEKWFRALAEAASQTSHIDIEFRVALATGAMRWLHARGRAYRLEEDDRANRVVGIISDITQRKEAEDQLRQAQQEAEAASHAKSQFVANISHEIRTPLGAISGFSELAMDPTTNEAERMAYLETIHRNSVLLSSLIGDILDLSKVEAGKLDIEVTQCQLPEILHSVEEIFSHKASSKGIDFIIAVDSSVPQQIKTDPIRLRQVLVNVIGNAIKFTSQGSVRIDIRTEAANENQLFLIADVADTGIGLSREQGKKVFQPFVQADGSVTRRFGGTGLGLVLSRRLAQALGGDLTLVKSEVNQGSTFRISILAERVQQIEQVARDLSLPARDLDVATTRQDSRPLSGMRILLVDDSRDNQLLVSRFISLAGGTIECADHGLEGVQKALAGRYDVVVMDIQMPILDGYRAARELRNNGYLLPLIALTAHALKGEQERCLEAGFDDFLTKPLDRPLLIQRIRKWCSTSPTQAATPQATL